MNASQYSVALPAPIETLIQTLGPDEFDVSDGEVTSATCGWGGFRHTVLVDELGEVGFRFDHIEAAPDADFLVHPDGHTARITRAGGLVITIAI